MAITVRITPISERPRLLMVENPHAPPPPTPRAPPSTRSSSPVSENEPTSKTVSPPTGLYPPHARYMPIRTHSSPATVQTIHSSNPTSYPSRPALIRATASSSLTDSPNYAEANSPSSEVSSDPWASFPSNDCSYTATCFHETPVTPPTNFSLPRGLSSHPVSQSSDYSRSRSSSSSSSSRRRASAKEKSRKRKRGASGASAGDRNEMMRCGRHGDEWLFEGWGNWFKRLWKE